MNHLYLFGKHWGDVRETLVNQPFRLAQRGIYVVDGVNKVVKGAVAFCYCLFPIPLVYID